MSIRVDRIDTCPTAQIAEVCRHVFTPGEQDAYEALADFEKIEDDGFGDEGLEEAGSEAVSPREQDEITGNLGPQETYRLSMSKAKLHKTGEVGCRWDSRKNVRGSFKWISSIGEARLSANSTCKLFWQSGFDEDEADSTDEELLTAETLES